MSKAFCVEGFLLMADLEERGRGYMCIVYFHARMNLPKFACYRLLGTMPKVKLVDSGCIKHGVLYFLLRCLLQLGGLFRQERDCFGPECLPAHIMVLYSCT